MSRLSTILRKISEDGLHLRPGGRWWVAPVYFVVGLWLHYEGRESTPVLYWLYVCVFGAAVIYADGLFIYRLLQGRRKES
jgi:hypothetical protein